MKPATWRAIVLASCALGALFVVVAFFDQVGMGGAPAWYGILGGYVSGSSEPYHVSIRGIDPGGPVDRAGIREGDSVGVSDQSVLVRLSLMGQFLAGRPVTMHVTNAGGPSQRVLVPGKFSVSRFWTYVVWELSCLWLLLFAALIAWRRPYVDNNLLLSTVLTCAGIAIVSSLVFFAFPWWWAYVASILIGQTGAICVALWAALASVFARPLSRARRIALGLSYAAAGAWVVFGNGTPDRSVGLAPLVGLLTLWFDPTRFIGPSWTLTEVAAVLAATVCSVQAILSSRAVDRQRAGWLLAPCALLFWAAAIPLLSFHFGTYAMTLDSGALYSVVAIIAPLVLTYAALNRRLIDVGFILNRTVVFAVVSSIVIGTFIVVEWAAGEWLATASHTTSVVIGMAVALALGLSMRYIHRYVDKFVDNLLFHKRHEDETALRRFAHEAAYVNDRAALLERTLKMVREHTTAESSDILVRNGAADYVWMSDGGKAVSENDPAIVALRAWSKPIDLHDVRESVLQGEIAFPMASRGRLVGALVCGPKRDGEAYAPDESEALAALARGVGSALDVLDVRGEGSSESTMAELVKLVRALPDALAERLVTPKE